MNAEHTVLMLKLKILWVCCRKYRKLGRKLKPVGVFKAGGIESIHLNGPESMCGAAHVFCRKIGRMIHQFMPI